MRARLAARAASDDTFKKVLARRLGHAFRFDIDEGKMRHQLDSAVFLRPDVKIECLMDRWLAWPHAIPPIQYAMNLAFRYLPAMQSFISNPRVHVAASNDPSLYGGPFIDLPETAVTEIAALAAETKVRCAALLQFADDLKKFDQSLQESASGYSLDEAYARLPESVATVAELVYDLNDHPVLKVIEELAPAAGLGNAASQEILLSDVRDCDRKFFMNTPRIASERNFFARVPFSSPMLDTLSTMRFEPAPLNGVAALFGEAALENERFHELFSSTPPERNAPHYRGDGVRVRHFGHACMLLQAAHITVLIDPIFTWDASASDQRFTYADMPDQIDFLVISHCHQDHFSPEALVQLRHKVRQVIVPRNRGGSLADPSMELILRNLGFTRITTLGPLDSVKFDGGEIVSLPFTGEHADLDIASKQTLFITLNGRKFFFLVDSDALNPALYRMVRDRVGRPDAMFIGMECNGAPLSWLYGPLIGKPIKRRNDESRRLSASNSDRAWRLVQELGCRRTFLYAMGQEPWLRYVMGGEYAPDSIQLQQVRHFTERCRAADIECEYLNISHELMF
jgi:L-ascorbate metabolism protein UlaG (beta-lactamase superfamily)